MNKYYIVDRLGHHISRNVIGTLLSNKSVFYTIRFLEKYEASTRQIYKYWNRYVL